MDLLTRSLDHLPTNWDSVEQAPKHVATKKNRAQLTASRLGKTLESNISDASKEGLGRKKAIPRDPSQVLKSATDNTTLSAPKAKRYEQAL